MSRTYDFKILFPDARLQGKKTPLAKSLDQAGMSVHTKFRASDPPDAVLTWFHGRNRVKQSIRNLIKKVDCPVIGIELPDEGNREDPITRLDYQLSHDTPYPLIGHTIRKIVEFFRLRKKTGDEKAKLEALRFRLDSVVDLGVQLTGTLSHHQLFDLVVNHSVKLVQGDVHALFTVDTNGTSCRLRSVQKSEQCNKFRITPTHRLKPDLKRFLSGSNKPVFGRAPFEDYAWMRQFTDHLGPMKSCLLAPFQSKDHILGFLIIARRDSDTSFTAAECEQIEILSSFSSMAMANAFIYEQTETASRTDNLTKVYNFAFIQQFLDRLISAGETFALIFIDLDGFKKINLLHGHTVGNKALKAAAGKIIETLVPYCMTGRFGGDEFVIVMPGTGVQEAMETAGNLIKSIESLEAEMDFRLSASAGIAIFPADGDDLNSLIHAADTAMYTAKDRGRGHAICFQELEKETPCD